MRRANSVASRKQISGPCTSSPRSPDDGETRPTVGYRALWPRKRLYPGHGRAIRQALPELPLPHQNLLLLPCSPPLLWAQYLARCSPLGRRQALPATAPHARIPPPISLPPIPSLPVRATLPLVEPNDPKSPISTPPITIATTTMAPSKTPE